ncbi:DNA recombination protein RmuC [Aminipila luticellarii]|uniref:DNA recombination protein RmuC n=1 Tax=Aminipila luticellarii TaxID=2507160 RepID=A0A410PVP6_9FIRM|nr:DNA recombination protein RmuC [Aminipila luticellarii]QAT43021.1 DNA recombination protein RmuC [Aminipila luticellarii]
MSSMIIFMCAAGMSLLFVIIGLLLYILVKRQLVHIKETSEKGINQVRMELIHEIKTSRQETLQFIQGSFKAMGDMVAGNQKESAESQDMRLAQLNRQFSDMTMLNEHKLENIRKTVETRLSALQEENSKQLEQMRNTVDEKLQKTLEDRISQSFKLVSERLEQVYKGLGEMQTLAAGVGDLKKVLSNVKTRGILGEIQLGAILEQILSKEQYEENIRTKSSGTERVEFAIKLPGDQDGVVYLPIDAKFPADAYNKLTEAYDSGNTAEIDEAGKNLERTIKKAAKDIHEKYVEPPSTTDFAIMFLPFEGLYAEVVRRGLVEVLQREYKINIAGPTTMAALLNSLQMGFKTLAIQKHSSQVWDILGAVKTEFDKFGTVLEATQQRINQANAELDKLIGTRTRSIQRKLRGITGLSELESTSILDLESDHVVGYLKDEEEE